MLKVFSSIYHDLVKSPFRVLKLAVMAGAGILLVALAVVPFWEEARIAVATLFAAYVVLTLLLGVLLFSRLVGKIRDIHATVSLYANLPPAFNFPGGLFVDGAAANASLLLFLLKCLKICRPQRILELGSGQTTKLFSEYYHSNPGVYVCTLEHSEAWIRELKPLLTHGGKCHDYRHAPLVDRDFVCQGTQERVHTLSYSTPPDFDAEKFDFILVDGPDNGPGTPYTREGVLEYMPGILAESFVVVFDDAERADEIHMVNKFERILRSSGRHFIRFEIEAVKTQTIFCSFRYAFLQSI